MLTVVAAAVGSTARGGSGMALAFGAVATLFGQAIIAAGAFRLELRPEEPAFLHLRIGRDELRLLAVWLVLLFAASLLAWLGALVGAAAPKARIAAEAVSLLLIAYLSLRFCLLAPSSFAERRIDVARAWRLTRGRTLALFGMLALVLCLIGVFMVAVLVALVLAALAIGGVHALAGVFGGAEALHNHPGVFLLVFAVQIILTPIFWMLAMAPLAAAYRALADSGAAARA
jgi:hypothetical protein